MRTMLVLAVLVFAAATARADDKALAALQKQEAAATAKCAAELVKCAKALVALKALDEAREELRLAMTVAPQDAVCRKEFAKLLAAKGDTPEAAAEKVAKTVGSAHAECCVQLVEVLLAWEKAGRPEEYAHLATTYVACLASGPESYQALEIAWYEPYVVWARKKDIERWEKGDEFVDGAWVDAEKVQALDAAHATWKTPWILGDGVHEVRTTVSLRAAKRVLEYLRGYRRHVIDFFAGEWEWKPPKGPLPVYLTGTQADYQARIRDFDPAHPASKAAAIYLQKSGIIGPVCLTFEPTLMGGGAVKIDWPALLRDVRHECAHQLLYESCMAQGAGVGGNIDWVSEGIANYLACHYPHEGQWKLARLAEEPYGTGYEPGPFAWVKANFEKVAPLAKYFTEFKANLDTVEDYYVATTLNYFLLTEVRWRPSMVKLLTEVHMARGGPKSFADCFGKVDFAKMQDEWKAFVDGISIQK